MAFDQNARGFNEIQKFRTGSGDLTVIGVTNEAPSDSTTVYEFATLTVAGGTSDYDVTATGGMFGTVTNASYIQIKNNDSTYALEVNLNAVGNDAISVPASGELVIDAKINVTNIFLTTNASHTGTTDIFLIGR